MRYMLDVRSNATREQQRVYADVDRDWRWEFLRFVLLENTRRFGTGRRIRIEAQR